MGLLEGIVPEDHPVKEIRGSAVFVEGPEINRCANEWLVFVCALLVCRQKSAGHLSWTHNP